MLLVFGLKLLYFRFNKLIFQLAFVDFNRFLIRFELDYFKKTLLGLGINSF